MTTKHMTVFANAAIDADTDIVLHTTHVDTDREVSILFGSERLTLEFYDVEGLERLRDVAAEGAIRLRAALAAGTA
jgi:hypothetical protein